MKKLLSLSLSMALLALAVSPAFAAIVPSSDESVAQIAITGSVNMEYYGDFADGFEWVRDASVQVSTDDGDNFVDGTANGLAQGTDVLNNNTPNDLTDDLDALRIKSTEGSSQFKVELSMGNFEDTLRGVCSGADTASLNKTDCLDAGTNGGAGAWAPDVTYTLAAAANDATGSIQVDSEDDTTPAITIAGDSACSFTEGADFTAGETNVTASAAVTILDTALNPIAGLVTSNMTSCSNIEIEWSPSLSLTTGANGFSASTYETSATYALVAG
jgi:hypothetical protein